MQGNDNNGVRGPEGPNGFSMGPEGGNGYGNGPQGGNGYGNGPQGGNGYGGPEGFNEFDNGSNRQYNNGFGQPTGPRIILESCHNLRRLGREALIGRWKEAVLVCFIMYLMLQIPMTVMDQLFGVEVPLNAYFQAEGMDASFYKDFDIVVKSSPLSGVYALLVTGALIFGVSTYFIALFRRGRTAVSDVFCGFERFVKTLALFLWMFLKIFLWALIPIAGIFLAVVAGLRYSQAFYILVDNPELSAIECVNQSKYIMRGNKLKFFLLNLSFIGWMILAVLPGAILISIANMITTNWVVLMAVDVISTFCVCIVTAYQTSSEVAFYDMLTGRIHGEGYIPGVY